MRVLLKLILECDADDAWAALQKPSVFRAVAAPFTTFESLEAGGFPAVWSEGVHPVVGKAFGVLPMGDQVIDLTLKRRPDGVRVFRDSGGGLSGVLALITRWEHTMAVSSLPGHRTLYRDRLVFEVGPVTLLAWPLFWAYWQWRGLRIQQLSKRWSA